MSDLDKDSRCVACKDTTYQCSRCQKKDKDAKQASRAAVVASRGAAAALTTAASAPAPAPSDASVAAPLLVAPAPAPSALAPAPSVLSVAAGVLVAPAPAPSTSAALGPAQLVPKKRAAKPKGDSAKKPKAKVPLSLSVSESESGVDEDDISSGSDEGEGGTLGASSGKPRKPPMPRILKSERVVVENWLQKNRKDGKMVNARWIRNGGAKGASMTATSGEVKTAGAHEALAMYVNKTLAYDKMDKRVWSTDIAKRRFQSIYKSFKEAVLLGSKGNSLAGCTLEEIQNNNTSLLTKQKAKCASFEVLLTLYENHPSVKPINPQELGALPKEDAVEEGDGVAEEGDGVAGSLITSDETVTTTPLAAAEPAPPAIAPVSGGGAAVAGPAAKGGKTPAPFAMKPSKEPKKMDLGEAYLVAQTAKTALLAAQGTAKQRGDMIVALSLQGKTKEEIEALLALLP